MVVHEILARLPDALGLNTYQAGLAGSWLQDQMLAALGRFVEIHTHGLHLFALSANWLEVGVGRDSARAKSFKRPPRRSLVPPGTMEPLETIVEAARNLPRKYHAVLTNRGWYVTMKQERLLVEDFAGYVAAFNRRRDDELIGQWRDLRDYALTTTQASAEEAYESLVATGAAARPRAEFIQQVIDRVEQRFPSPDQMREKLWIALVDAMRPDEMPQQDVIAQVLGLKDAIEAEARAGQARAEKIETEAAAARTQLDMLTVQQQVEREMYEDMYRRRAEMAEQMMREETRAQVAPVLAAFRNAHETIGVVVAEMLAEIRDGRQPARGKIAAVKRAIRLYEALSMGEIELDQAVAQLKDIVNRPVKKRTAQGFERVLKDIDAITAIEVARLQAAREDSWSGMLRVPPAEQEEL